MRMPSYVEQVSVHNRGSLVHRPEHLCAWPMLGVEWHGMSRLARQFVCDLVPNSPLGKETGLAGTIRIAAPEIERPLGDHDAVILPVGDRSLALRLSPVPPHALKSASESRAVLHVAPDRAIRTVRHKSRCIGPRIVKQISNGRCREHRTSRAAGEQQSHERVSHVLQYRAPPARCLPCCLPRVLQFSGIPPQS